MLSFSAFTTEYTEGTENIFFSSIPYKQEIKTSCRSEVNHNYFPFYVGLTMIVLPELVTQSVTFIVARIGCGKAAEGRLNRVIRSR